MIKTRENIEHKISAVFFFQGKYMFVNMIDAVGYNLSLQS